MPADAADPEVQYERLRAILLSSTRRQFRDRPLRDWAEPDESHLPSALVKHPVADLVQFSLAEHRARRGVGERKIEQFLVLLERAAQEAGHDSEARLAAGSGDVSPIEPSVEYGRLRLDLLSVRSEEARRVLERPLRDWRPLDPHELARQFSDPPLVSLLTETYADHCEKRSVGEKKVGRFLELLREVRDSLCGDESSAGVTFAEWVDDLADEPAEAQPVGNPEPPPALPADAARLNDAAWGRIHELFVRHHLAPQPLGRFAVSLVEVPRSRWTHPLGDYTGKPLAQTRDVPGMGEVRFGKIADVILRAAAPLDHVDRAGSNEDGERERMSVQVLPERIARVRAWVDGVLAGEERPSTHLIVTQFLEPLLEQVGWDLGAETAECLRGRLGLDGEVLTLQTLAEEFDLSRERIRQLTGRAGDALAVRWPEARHLLDDFYEHFRPYADAAEPAALVGRTMDLLFNVEVSGDETPAEVLEKWRKVGRDRLTPLTTDELLSWAAGACPGVKPEIARGWIDAACPAVPSGGIYAAEGETLHFTEEPLDTLLVTLLRDDEPPHLRDAAAALEMEERSLKGRLDRDLRFLRDEFGRVTPSGRFRLSRRGDVWQIALPPEEDRGGEERIVSLEALRSLIVSGLSTRGVHDATAWGVHRFAVEMLRRLYGVTLPPGLDQFLLADVLVQESGGEVRPMRRRRLRWDGTGGTAAALGKRGWVCRVVAESGGPLLLAEIDPLMRRHYQDYEPYVINQLANAFAGRDAGSPDDEEGENPHAIRFEGGGPLPTFVVPDGWRFDPAATNVSTGVLRAAHRAANGRSGASDTAPEWFRGLLKEVRSGHSPAPAQPSDDDDGPTGPSAPHSSRETPASPPLAAAPPPPVNLDEALAGLF